MTGELHMRHDILEPAMLQFDHVKKIYFESASMKTGLPTKNIVM